MFARGVTPLYQPTVYKARFVLRYTLNGTSVPKRSEVTQVGPQAEQTVTCLSLGGTLCRRALACSINRAVAFKLSNAKKANGEGRLPRGLWCGSPLPLSRPLPPPSIKLPTSPSTTVSSILPLCFIPPPPCPPSLRSPFLSPLSPPKTLSSIFPLPLVFLLSHSPLPLFL